MGECRKRAEVEPNVRPRIEVRAVTFRGEWRSGVVAECEDVGVADGDSGCVDRVLRGGEAENRVGGASGGVGLFRLKVGADAGELVGSSSSCRREKRSGQGMLCWRR